MSIYNYNIWCIPYSFHHSMLKCVLWCNYLGLDSNIKVSLPGRSRKMTQPMSCKKTLPIWNVWCENESCKKENSQSSSLRPIQWHELRVMFFSLPCGAAQQHLHLRCELRSIHCQYMPLLLWTASFAPVPEICINHWICVDNLTRRSIHIVFALLHRTVCFPWSEDSSCTGCTIPLKWNQSFEGLSHSSTIFWRSATLLLFQKDWIRCSSWFHQLRFTQGIRFFQLSSMH